MAPTSRSDVQAGTVCLSEGDRLSPPQTFRERAASRLVIPIKRTRPWHAGHIIRGHDVAEDPANPRSINNHIAAWRERADGHAFFVNGHEPRPSRHWASQTVHIRWWYSGAWITMIADGWVAPNARMAGN